MVDLFKEPIPPTGELDGQFILAAELLESSVEVRLDQLVYLCDIHVGDSPDAESAENSSWNDR